MRSLLLSFATVLLISSSVAAQKPLAEGASKFFKEAGGLTFSPGKPDIIQKIAGDRIDKVEAGGGVADWTKVDGRIFARAVWMVEIGEMAADYGVFELEQSIAAEMQKRLTSEGFSITPGKFDLHYIRYQKGNTIGSVEVRSCFLKSGNLPLRYDFIFNESYLPSRTSRKSERKPSREHL